MIDGFLYTVLACSSIFSTLRKFHILVRIGIMLLTVKNLVMVWQATLRSDLPSYMVPFKTPDLVFQKPQVF